MFRVERKDKSAISEWTFTLKILLSPPLFLAHEMYCEVLNYSPPSKETINGILDDLNILERRGRPGAAELTRLLKNLQLKSLLGTHDSIAKAKMQVCDPNQN